MTLAFLLESNDESGVTGVSEAICVVNDLYLDLCLVYLVRIDSLDPGAHSDLLIEQGICVIVTGGRRNKGLVRDFCQCISRCGSEELDG